MTLQEKAHNFALNWMTKWQGATPEAKAAEAASCDPPVTVAELEAAITAEGNAITAQRRLINMRATVVSEWAKHPERYAAVDPDREAARLEWTRAEFDTSIAQVKAAQEAAKPEVVPWQTLFRLPMQLEEGDITQFIKGILVEGINGIGGGSGVGKTWLLLSMMRALSTGTKFLGVFDVPEKCNVLYLTPEVGDKAFKKRLEKMRIPMDGNFRCQTAKDGLLKLNHPSLETYIGEMKPIVCLDTVIRYNQASDESSASQSAKLLAPNLLQLIKWGAKAVAFNHHCPKKSADEEFMTLENMFRGSGDIGAMCDAALGIQRDKIKLPNGKDNDPDYYEQSKRLTRLKVSCVKSRDFDPVQDFRIQGRPHIDQHGDFAVLSEREEVAIEDQLVEAIASCPTAPMRTLRSRFGMGQVRLEKMMEKRGLRWDGHVWQKSVVSTVLS